MTTKEKQLKVLELFGLKVGDKIRFSFNKIDSEIVETQTFYAIKEDTLHGIDLLIEYDWKKVEPSLKDKKCKEFENCYGCPFADSFVSCGDIEVVGENLREATLEDVYNGAEKELEKLKKEIYEEEEISVKD